MTKKIAALQVTRGTVIRRDQSHGNLKFFQSLFEQIHFFISEAEIVMGFVIAVPGCVRFRRNTILLEYLSQTGVDRLKLRSWWFSHRQSRFRMVHRNRGVGGLFKSRSLSRLVRFHYDCSSTSASL